MRTGDICDECHVGTMRRRSTKTVGRTRTRYLKCDHCATTGKEITSIDDRGRDVGIPSDTNTIACPCCHAMITA